MYPEDPRSRRLFSGPKTVLDGKLRLPLQTLAVNEAIAHQAYPTPPNPTSAVLEAGTEHLSCIRSRSVPRSTKSVS